MTLPICSFCQHSEFKIKRNGKILFSPLIGPLFFDSKDLCDAILFPSIDDNTNSLRNNEKYKIPSILCHDKKKKEFYVHELCVIWSPKCFKTHDNLFVVNVYSEILRASKLKCCKCKLKGAATGCFDEDCSKSIHVKCVFESKDWNIIEESYQLWCKKHSDIAMEEAKEALVELEIAEPKVSKNEKSNSKRITDVTKAIIREHALAEQFFSPKVEPVSILPIEPVLVPPSASCLAPVPQVPTIFAEKKSSSRLFLALQKNRVLISHECTTATTDSVPLEMNAALSAVLDQWIFPTMLQHEVANHESIKQCMTEWRKLEHDEQKKQEFILPTLLWK